MLIIMGRSFYWKPVEFRAPVMGFGNSRRHSGGRITQPSNNITKPRTESRETRVKSSKPVNFCQSRTTSNERTSKASHVSGSGVGHAGRRKLALELSKGEIAVPIDPSDYIGRTTSTSTSFDIYTYNPRSKIYRSVNGGCSNEASCSGSVLALLLSDNFGSSFYSRDWIRATLEAVNAVGNLQFRVEYRT
ncbi:hypothetical protein KQX54_005253 [Cotesia glomerata]|uniref:Uncharacterized protein n=1 Tax=Cotesia glomerata TaxID=32391 RepID=A0AAV7I146_COTGL|nr:hypothetical protein KQX54_005253 [Cotesia glomerata]